MLPAWIIEILKEQESTDDVKQLQLELPTIINKESETSEKPQPTIITIDI